MNMGNLKQPDTRTAPQFRVNFSSGFILLFAFIYFFDQSGFLSALLPAVLVHELGHVSAMRMFGAYPTKLNATLSGFALDYSGDLNERQEILTAIAGPAFGFVFSILCAKTGTLRNNEYLLMCAGLGFILNTFNLLPAKALDGGRILYFALMSAISAKFAQIAIHISGLLISGLLIAAGLYCIAKNYGFSLFLAGIWLFILQQNKSCK
ncbi:MAG: site-2 protease family protein [Oscillospiraceae bacterium]|jgi:Zn-dependent protease